MTTTRTPGKLEALREASRLTIRETARRTGSSEAHVRAILAGKRGASPYVLASLDHVIVSDALRQRDRLNHVLANIDGGAA